MAGPAYDFLLETCSASGTADYSLGGPPADTPYRGAVAQASTGGVFAYIVQSDVTFKWEIGYGTVTDASPDTLTRNVKKSWDGVTLSNSAKISWSAGDGTLRMYCAPAAFLINGALTHHRDTVAPTPAFPGMVWEDISSLTAVVWKHYDGTDWITFPWVINETANTIAFSNLLLAANPTAALGAAPKQYVDQQGRSAIWGLAYSNNGSDATNDIDIAAGGCMDATGAYWIAVAAITKRLDAGWAVGTNQGGLDTGSIGNNDYYIWAILRSDTGVTDILFSLSSTAPTMPANYDYKRLIGWFRRTGAANVAFKTYELAGGGLEYAWTTPIRDVNVANTLTTTRRTDALSVPLNFSTLALIRAVAFDASASFYASVCCPDETDAAPSGTAAPGATLSNASSAGIGSAFDGAIRTSATGTVASRATIATVDNYIIVTRGFIWSRR